MANKINVYIVYSYSDHGTWFLNYTNIKISW